MAGIGEYLTLKQYAAKMDVSIPTVYNWLNQGKVKCRQVGGTKLFHRNTRPRTPASYRKDGVKRIKVATLLPENMWHRLRKGRSKGTSISEQIENAIGAYLGG